MNILSFQFEDFFQHFSWGGTSGDELHQVCFVWDSFYFSFISERQLFWKEYSWLAGFSLLALWVCPWMKAKLLLVAGEPGRHLSFSHDAAVTTSCGWFKSELSSPGQIFPWFLLSWYMCLMSFKIPPKLSVAFFCEFSFSFIFGCVGSLPPQCLCFSVWWLLLMLRGHLPLSKWESLSVREPFWLFLSYERAFFSPLEGVWESWRVFSVPMFWNLILSLDGNPVVLFTDPFRLMMCVPQV